MSVDVYGNSGEETFFSNAGWAFVLNFAMEYGWHPAETMAPPNHKDWDGNYDAAEGQTISASDAEALATALSRGLDAPDRSERSKEVAAKLTHEVGASIDAFEFSPQSVEHWKNFINIARKGSFVIW